MERGANSPYKPTPICRHKPANFIHGSCATRGSKKALRKAAREEPSWSSGSDGSLPHQALFSYRGRIKKCHVLWNAANLNGSIEKKLEFQLQFFILVVSATKKSVRQKKIRLPMPDEIPRRLHFDKSNAGQFLEVLAKKMV